MNDAKRVVHSDPEILGGTPVFVGTRVPVRNLIDFLEAGDGLEDFLTSVPPYRGIRRSPPCGLSRHLRQTELSFSLFSRPGGVRWEKRAAPLGDQTRGQPAGGAEAPGI